MRTLRNSFIALTILAAAPAARADIVSVQGTAEFWGTWDTTNLAAIDFAVGAGDTLSFSYTYDTCDPSAGTFHAAASNGSSFQGALLVNPFPGYQSPTGEVFDFYQAGGFATRNGIFSTIMMDLEDLDRNLLPLDVPAYLNVPLSEWETNRLLVGVASPNYPAEGWGWFYDAEAIVTSLQATRGTGPACGGGSGDDDADDDGILDDADACDGTETGAPVNSTGCSVNDLVPCDGPTSGGAWKNHGAYVSTVTQVARQQYQAGTITKEQRDALIGGAAASDCGH